MKLAPMDWRGWRQKITWKSVTLMVIGLVIAGSLFQVLAHPGGSGAINTTGGGGGQSAAATAKGSSKGPSHSPTPTATVTLGGHGIAASGGPIIVLNPGLVTPGGKVGINGSGFDAGATVDIVLTSGTSKTGQAIGLSKIDKDGSLSAQFTMPQNLPNADANVVATQRGGNKSATAQVVSPGGVGSLTVSKTTGKPGDKVGVSATGFQPGETVDVFWARISGTPVAKLTADSGGGIGKASVPVGVAPVGVTTMVMVGEKSQTAATAPFQMLGLYPTATTTPYALKAGNRLAVTGAGFAPGEQVQLYVNASGGTPALVANADSQGGMNVQFAIPYGLKGNQTLTMIGAQTRASVSSGFDVLPYTPVAQASTYGALPGTTVSFYASGYAPNEVVLVYTGKGQGASGNLVSAFRVDGQGNAAAAGQYVIPSNAQKGVSFTLVGRLSQGTTSASVTVDAAKQQVTVPAQPPYSLPSDLATDPPAAP